MRLLLCLACSLALGCAPAVSSKKSKDAGGGELPFNPTGQETTGGETAGETTEGETTEGETTEGETTEGETTEGETTEGTTEGETTEGTTEGETSGGETAQETTGGETGGTDIVEPPPAKDTDEDEIPDKDDNCTFDANPDQADLDKDGLGDVCDPDIDGDQLFNDADCEPMNGSIFPGNPEVCNGIDDNCDGIVDGMDSVLCVIFYDDADQDGSGTTESGQCLCEKADPTQAPCDGDCDDNNPLINPWAFEICNDLDENCNLIIDDGCDDDADGYCDSNLPIVGSPAICPMGGGDCFDWSPMINPQAFEVAADGLDNDCDGIKLGEPTGKLTPDCSTFVCLGQSMEAVQCGLDLCYPTLPDMVKNITVSSPTGSSFQQAYATVAHFGSPSNDLAPFGPPSYVLLATGPATGTSHSSNIGGSSKADPWDPGGALTYNNVEIKMQVKAPPGAKGFSLDYIFFSEEYEEYIGSTFNDKFYMILNAPQTTGGQDTIINFTQCSNPGSYFDFQKDGQKWCYIAINTAFSEPCTNVTTNIAGTGYECGSGGSSAGSSTGWLVTTWPIESEEEFTITFHIHDTGDGIYDSEVIMDNWVWEAETVVGGTASHN